MKADVKFYSYSFPGWEKGTYRIKIRQETNIPEEKNHSETVGYEDSFSFMVSQKRLTINREEIYSVYPPAGSEGLYGSCLPHVVFRRDTIPWEYCLERREGEDPVAGLALFVFSNDEEVTIRMVKKTEADQVDGEDIFVPAGFAWQDEDADERDGECCVLDMPGQLFSCICPSRRELALLSHVREVKLNDKVTDPEIENGVFACVTANRFPREPRGEEAAVEHTACIVSLKEYEQLLDHRERAVQYKKMRLFCLYQFSFSVGRQLCDFAGLIESMETGVLAREPDDRVKDERLRGILYRGYLPMDHKLRDGSQTVSWYRGPLLPYFEMPERPQYHVYADSQYRIDPETGMLDVSYACAWQLGRMFAMENLHSLRSLLEWRYEHYRKAAVMEQEQQILKQLLPEKEEESLRGTLEEICRSGIENIPIYQEESDEK